MEHPDTHLSLVMDGMDQQHTRIPHLGGQDKFKEPLSMHVQGILEHGFGKLSELIAIKTILSFLQVLRYIVPLIM
jgi:hypothetical protein